MAPRARRCAGCGGPLPVSPPDARIVTCEFCATVNDLPGADAGGRIVLDLRGTGAPLSRAAKRAIRIGIGLAALVVAFGILRAIRPITETIEQVNQQAADMNELLRPLAPAELAKLETGGWRTVQADAPPSGWAAFDPVRGIEWASGVARAWAADARLTRIDVSRVSAEGLMNLSAEGEDRVGYRFVSPARIAGWDARADREVNAQAVYGLTLELARERVRANVTRGRPGHRDRVSLPPPDSLPLGELLARAKRSRRFSEYPFYAGYLTHLDRDGWVWYLSSLSRRETLPRVRARDGAVHPYR